MRRCAESLRTFCAAAVLLIMALGFALPGPSAAQTPMPTPGGDCCTPHAGPDCDVVECSECVCATDPLCCRAGESWDVICVADTFDCPEVCLCSMTPSPTPTPGGACCSPHQGPGCDNPTCQACVCAEDDQCCLTLWDATCVAEAGVECSESCGCAPPPTETPAPTPTPGGDCCTAHAGANCDDSACRTCVCNRDSACCDTVWDQTCTEEARLECALECSCPTVGSCCAPHGGVGCDDVVCKDCVCEIDAACCTDGQGWDADCVSRANVECVASCTCEVAGSCCEGHPDTLGCDDRRCQDCVCAFDEPCCTEGWDARCAEVAGSDCSERCTGCVDCCDDSDTPGCSDNVCEACVCALDNFCCDEAWDGSCVDRAFENCASNCTCTGAAPCPGDCGGDDEVAVNELVTAVNITLGNNPVADCTAVDTDGNGEVAINELIQAVNSVLNGCPA